MASPANIRIGPISQPERIRPEWEVVDLESGTCTTQIYLFPDEINITNTRFPTATDVPTQYSTVHTMALCQGSPVLYWNHPLISSPPTNTTVAMSKSYTQPSFGNSEKDIRIRSKSTPSRLRGDAKEYVPRRAISLGNLPLSSTSVAPTESSSAYTSMLMTKDVAMRNSILRRSPNMPLPNSPPAYVSSLMRANTTHPAAPKSPRMKFTPTFPTLDETTALQLRSQEYRRLLLSYQLRIQAKKLKPTNPYITITRGHGSLEISLKYNRAPIYSITVEPETNSDGSDAKRQDAVGPYRTAAVWEFVGRTFGKHERNKRFRPKRRRTMRGSLERITPPSSLSQELLADDDMNKNMFDNAEVRAEWTSLVNSADSLNRLPQDYVSRILALSSQVMAHENNHRGPQLDHGRGRSRIGADMLGRYSLEQMPPIPSFPTPFLPYARHEDTLREHIEVNNGGNGVTNPTGEQC